MNALPPKGDALGAIYSELLKFLNASAFWSHLYVRCRKTLACECVESLLIPLESSLMIWVRLLLCSNTKRSDAYNVGLRRKCVSRSIDHNDYFHM